MLNTRFKIPTHFISWIFVVFRFRQSHFICKFAFRFFVFMLHFRFNIFKNSCKLILCRAAYSWRYNFFSSYLLLTWFLYLLSIQFCLVCLNCEVCNIIKFIFICHFLFKLSLSELFFCTSAKYSGIWLLKAQCFRNSLFTYPREHRSASLVT